MAYGFVGVGVLLLILGSEALLHGGIGLSKFLGLPHLLIGLVVVSTATSAPELAVALNAAKSHPEIAIGCIVGGTIANILLILGLGALARPLPSPPKIVFRDGGTMLVACLALIVIAIGGTITRRYGLILLGGFVAYLALTFATEWRRPYQHSATEARANCRDADRAPGVNFFILALGIAMVFVGARCLMDGGLVLAQMFHLPSAILGLTVVALATAIPELVITITAFTGRYTDAAVSHVLAANVFNLLVVLGLVAVIHPLAIAPLIAHADIYVMAGAALLLMPLMIMSWRLSRLNGFFLVLCYGGYGAFLAWRMGYLAIPHLL
ncbi:MAG TPA: calcium/sodium antiporter [Rhizomicrobium sp.]|jgi:cation:H+ antiporter